mmetsp:Transcript_26789/g.65994  ORF Transcript_26789/g.65994 Transcript_26789/m.65994 type:complete len:428 (-) Transcript_26789:4764-6047(-)
MRATMHPSPSHASPFQNMHVSISPLTHGSHRSAPHESRFETEHVPAAPTTSPAVAFPVAFPPVVALDALGGALGARVGASKHAAMHAEASGNSAALLAPVLAHTCTVISPVADTVAGMLSSMGSCSWSTATPKESDDTPPSIMSDSKGEAASVDVRADSGAPNPAPKRLAGVEKRPAPAPSVAPMKLCAVATEASMLMPPFSIARASSPVTAPLSCDAASPASPPISRLPGSEEVCCRPPRRLKTPRDGSCRARTPRSSRRRRRRTFLAERVSRAELRVPPEELSAVGSSPTLMVLPRRLVVMPSACTTEASESSRRTPSCTHVPARALPRALWKPAISVAVMTMSCETPCSVPIMPSRAVHVSPGSVAKALVSWMTFSASCVSTAWSSSAVEKARMRLRAPASAGRCTTTARLTVTTPANWSMTLP